MMKKTIILLSVSVLTLFTLTACKAPLSANDYDQATVGDVQQVQRGTVVSVEKVNIKGKSDVGTGVGAAAGGIAGSYVGGGRAALLGGLGGAVVGGLVGREVGKALNNQEGLRYVVQLDNPSRVDSTRRSAASGTGRSEVTSRRYDEDLVTVIQGFPSNKNETLPRVGDPVLIMRGGSGRARVILDHSRLQQPSRAASIR